MITKVTRRKALLGICGMAGASLLPGCAINPVTGRKEFMLMTESQEIALGQSSHEEIIQQYGVYNNTSLQNWFSARGAEMAKVTHRPGLPYKFTVLDSPVVNAFAVPGGFVYITRGIMGYFNDEAQLAGVLGHELGHVNARHSARQYSQSQLANLTLSLGSIFSEEFARYAQFASVGMSLMFLKFSRDDEREADRLGVEYSSKVKYDAVGMSTFFVTLERMRPAGGSLPEWQSTHPDPGNRIGATREQALAYQQKNPGEYVKRRNEYLELVEGLPFGDDPRQGYVREGVFYHPQLAFRFPVPNGWTLSNSPAEVRMTPGTEDGLLLFTLASGSDPQAAAVAFAQANSVASATSAQVTINGMTATRLTGTITSDSQQLALVSHFIKKSDKVFAFHGIAAPGSSHATVFSTVANGFANLTDKARLSVTPKLIHVRSAGSAMTLTKAFSSFSVPQDQLETLAIVNGLQLNDTVPAGTRIKIVS